MISVTFEKQDPTEKMWNFAKAISSELEIKMPEYEFESVHEFIDQNIDLLWEMRRKEEVNIGYDIWKYHFWVVAPIVEEDPDLIIGHIFIED